MRELYINISTLISKKRIILLSVFLLAISIIAAGCSSDKNETHAYNLAPLEKMHPYVQAAPVTVQTAYQFAHSHPEILKQFPCYCGCGAMGHTSNYACYINESNGELAFDNHALGCSICVDITQDVMRLMDGGHSLSYMQEFVDKKYSAFGPSNMP